MLSEAKMARPGDDAEALADLLVDRQRPSEQDAPGPGEQPSGRRARSRCRGLGYQHALAAIAEVLRVRPLDADTPVAEPPAFQLAVGREVWLGASGSLLIDQ